MSLPEDNNRIKMLIDHYCDGKELQFSQAIGISQPRINRLFNVDARSGKYPAPSYEIVQAVINKFINVDAEWLITGRGSMLRASNEDALVNIVADFTKPYDKKYDNQRVPLYRLDATAGITTLFMDDRQQTPVGHIDIPNLPRCDGATYIVGDSMYPLLKSGDIVLYKRIRNIEDNIDWGSMYLLSIDMDGDDYITVKYVQSSEQEGFIKLVSQNQHHDTREIPISKVREMAIIKASIRFNTLR